MWDLLITRKSDSVETAAVLNGIQQQGVREIISRILENICKYGTAANRFHFISGHHFTKIIYSLLRRKFQRLTWKNKETKTEKDSEVLLDLLIILVDEIRGKQPHMVEPQQPSRSTTSEIYVLIYCMGDCIQMYCNV